jgi:hypothetical protein
MAKPPRSRQDKGTEGEFDGSHVEEPAFELSSEDRAELDATPDDEVLDADAELVTRLAEQGYAGEEWDKTRRRLVEYATPRIKRWIEGGAVFPICWSRDLTTGPRPPSGQYRYLRDEAVGFTWEAVQRAIRAFPEVLERKPWSREKGRTFDQYFLTQCLIQFSQIYKPWQRMLWPRQPNSLQRHSQGQAMASSEFREPEDTSAGSDIAATVIGNVDTAREIEQLTSGREGKSDEVLKRILEGLTRGQAHKQIGKEVDLTPKAVERRVGRLRAKRKKGRDDK